jgi:hypothetical protein
VPISLIKTSTENLSKRQDTMSVQDRELAVLYWKLQKRVHTDPKIRSYLHEVTRILQKRHIRPTALNRVGLELAHEGQI